MLQTDPLPQLGIVIWVEDVGERGIFGRLVEEARVVALELKIARRVFGRPKAESQDRIVRRFAIAHDRRVVGKGAHLFAIFQEVDIVIVFIFGRDRFAAEADQLREGVAPRFPGVVVEEPAIGPLHLDSVPNFLLENAILIAEAVAARRVVESGERIEEARREAAQAAVAEPRIGFARGDFVEIPLEFFQDGVNQFGGADVSDIVAQEPAREIFHRQEIGDLCFFVFDRVERRGPIDHHLFFERRAECLVELLDRGVAEPSAARGDDEMLNFLGEDI